MKTLTISITCSATVPASNAHAADAGVNTPNFKKISKMANKQPTQKVFAATQIQQKKLTLL